MLDMIKPTTPGCVTLADLKRCKMTPIFFDTFFNLEKYMEHEQRDPFAQRDNDDVGIRLQPSVATLFNSPEILIFFFFVCYSSRCISWFSLQLSDWDRYAAQEYELLVAEEGGDTQG